MSDSSKLLLIIVTFAVAADTFRRYWKWREGALEQDDGGELRPIHRFEVAFGIAFVILLLGIYVTDCQSTAGGGGSSTTVKQVMLVSIR